nr:hypothetical protein [Tanacetum cinerariifolium]
MSFNAEVTYSEGKVLPSDEGSQPSEDEVSLSHATIHADYSQANEGMLENLLIWARNKKNDSSTFKCRVKINDTRSRKGWNFQACGGEKCKKGVVRKNKSYWGQVCEKAVDYPVLRFWIELDVSDKSASTVVVMFDEPVKELLKCSADSLAAADDESRFGYADHAGLPLALANIIEDCPEEAVDVDSESRNMNTSAEVNITKVKRLATKPSVITPSKPTKEKGKREELEDSDDEVKGDMDDGGPSELQATKAVGLTSEINRQAVMD